MELMTIRRATLEDKEHVLAIHDNVYEGLDYLPAKYDHLLSCRNAKSYVGIINGEIIAFAVAFIVDGGHTVVTRAGRVSPKYARRGLYSALETHVIQQSGVRKNAFTAVSTNMAVSTVSFQRKFKLVLTKELYKYLFNPHTVPINKVLTLCQFTVPIIRQTTGTDLERYMTSDEHRTYLFPDDVIIVNWVPYGLQPSNIPLIGVPGRTNILTNVDAGNQTGLLSAVTVYFTKNPPFTANLDIYGSDPQSLEAHIATQIEYLREHVDGVLCLMVFFDGHLGGAAIEQSFDRFRLKKSISRSATNSKIVSSKQFLFRRYACIEP